MIYKNIKVGTKVRPVCENALTGVPAKSLGRVIKIKKTGGNGEGFYATIRWDNGTETGLNAMFFSKILVVVVVEEVLA